MSRETFLKTMQHVANDGAGRRGHDADDTRQERNLALLGLIEEAFGGQTPLALLELRHKRAEACRLEALDHDLILG